MELKLIISKKKVEWLQWKCFLFRHMPQKINSFTSTKIEINQLEIKHIFIYLLLETKKSESLNDQ